MNPVAFHIGSWPVYWYGIFAALGFLAAMTHWSWLARRQNRPAGMASDVALWLMAGGLIGARTAYVIANWPEYAGHPAAIFAIHEGGLIFYGGAVGGAAALTVYALLKRFPLGSFSDFVVSAVPLGHALGRVGCFTRGCCFGSACADSGWAVWVEGAPRHPVQLYEAAALLALYAGLAVLLRSPRRHAGLTTSVYLAGYGMIRFILEFWRGDARQTAGGLDVAQWISVALMVSGLALAAWRRHARIPDPSPER